MRLFLVTSALLLSLTACANGSERGEPGAGGAPTHSNRILGEVIPSLGIRTDVSEFIISRYGDFPAKLEAARLVAKHDQTALRVVVNNVSLTQAEVSKRAYALGCLFDAVGPREFQRVSRELKAATFNTPDRLRASADFGKKLAGLDIGGPNVANDCEAAR